MQTQRYFVNQHQIATFLAFVKDGQIDIPGVQRPFVWDSSKVRDLSDSLYKGYPIGYVITWQNPNVRLKDGKLSEGKKILNIFPKKYLKSNFKSRGDYNQIANYVLMQREINISIGAKSPDSYFKEIQKQCQGGRLKYGAIDNHRELEDNLRSHCILFSIFDASIDVYDVFLHERRKLMAAKIRAYYEGLYYFYDEQGYKGISGTFSAT